MDGTVNGILFASGETVTINGTVNGDALLFGNMVILAPGAKVTGNVFLGARRAQIEGSISGSLFGGAAAVTLEKTAMIGRNLYYGGYSLQASSGSAVTRDAFLGVYQAILDGEIQRDVNFGGAALEVNGRIGRNLNAEVGGTENGFRMSFGDQQDLPKAIEPGLRVAESAVISGKMVYTSPEEQAGAIKVEPDGGMIYQTPAPNEDSTTITKKPALTVRYPALGWLADFLRNFVTLLALGALALWLLPAVVQRIVGQARTATSSIRGLRRAGNFQRVFQRPGGVGADPAWRASAWFTQPGWSLLASIWCWSGGMDAILSSLNFPDQHRQQAHCGIPDRTGAD